jgi:hypothetical protein
MALIGQDARAQQGETRLALIIANETYVASPALQSLPGAMRDAQVMQDALGRAGFEVSVVTNQNRQQMLAQLAGFARRLSEAGPHGVGFLYYSGHGVGQDGENYLIPVDAQIQGVTDLPAWGVPLSEQLTALSRTGARAAIVVLDACRTSFGRGSRGLAAVATRTDTLVAFSTQPNDLAADDGLYARMLAQEITRPGADSVTAFARVTSAVANATQRAQIPRYENGLIDPVVFVPENATMANTIGANATAGNTVSPSGASAVQQNSSQAMQQASGNTVLERAQAAFVQQWRTLDGSGSFSRLDSMCKRHIDIISLSETEMAWKQYNDRPPDHPTERHRVVELSDALVQTVESRLGIPMRTTFSISAGHLFFRYGITSCDYILAPH